MPTIIDELIVLIKTKTDGKQVAAAAQTTAAQVKKTAQISAADQERIANSQAQRLKDREAKQEKARKDQDRAAKKRKDEKVKDAQEFGSKILGVAKGLSAAFLGFETLKGAINLFANITTATAALGRNSENLGQSAHDLQTWQLAVKKVGGDAGDVDKTFSALSQTFTGALLQGKSSPLLELLNQFGVAARDARGQIRPMTDVLLQLDDAMKARGLSRPNRFNLAAGAGVGEGVFNLLEDPNRAKYLSDSSSSAFASQKQIDDSKYLQERFNRLKEYTGAVTGGIAGEIADTMRNGVGETWRHRSDVFNANKAQYSPVIAAAEQKYDLPVGTLARLISQESGFNPKAYNTKVGATGIAQLNPKFFPNAGKDPNADIDEAARYLVKLQKYYHGDLGLAVSAYNAGPGRIDKVLKGTANLPIETYDYAQKVYGSTPDALTHNTTNGGADHSVNVTTGPVTVHTKATDADGVATDFMGAMKSRAGMIAQSNNGMTP